VPAFLAASIVIAACGSGAGDPAADVSITSCQGAGHSVADFVIHNHASEPAKYSFQLNFVANGHIYSSIGTGTANDDLPRTIQPGAVVKGADGTEDPAPRVTTPVTCRITDVRRTLVPNGRPG
jgi:hypothetical protein